MDIASSLLRHCSAASLLHLLRLGQLSDLAIALWSLHPSNRCETLLVAKRLSDHILTGDCSAKRVGPMQSLGHTAAHTIHISPLLRQRLTLPAVE